MKPLLLLLAGLVLLAGTPVLPLTAPTWTLPLPLPVVQPATAAVYVYEKDATAVPAGVTAGLDRLNRERKVVATMLEEDAVDGGGDVPEQYRPALQVAKDEGPPVLVVLSGTTVVKVVKAPTTVDQVLEAVP